MWLLWYHGVQLAHCHKLLNWIWYYCEFSHFNSVFAVCKIDSSQSVNVSHTHTYSNHIFTMLRYSNIFVSFYVSLSFHINDSNVYYGYISHRIEPIG